MSKKLNIQDVFLNYVRKKRIPVIIYLVNGVKM
ncbi:MAG: RNA chaperone Hfq, partial [Deferribacterales bacterium]